MNKLVAKRNFQINFEEIIKGKLSALFNKSDETNTVLMLMVRCVTNEPFSCSAIPDGFNFID